MSGGSEDEPGLNQIRAVSFDLDGTLYGAKPVRRRFAFKNVFSLRAVRVRQAVRTELRPQAFADGAAFFEEETRLCAERLDLGGEQTRALLDDLFGERLCAVLRAVGPRADARSALTSLVERGFKIAVVSDFAVDDKLEALGLTDLPFSATVAADACGALKPHRRAFNAAANALGVNPSEILHVGDRMDTDVAGAIAAGQIPFFLGPPPDGESVAHGAQLSDVVALLTAKV